ncbi:MAG: hypothetical protein MZV70_42255 [Desulfobacterales bacterium]|nr:hypothetical protein [Desulfobacterales bacterium]
MDILFIKLGALGDVINTLPLAVTLKEQLHARIHWLVEPLSYPLVAGHPCVEEAILFDRRRWPKALSGVVRQLRGGTFRHRSGPPAPDQVGPLLPDLAQFQAHRLRPGAVQRAHLALPLRAYRGFRSLQAHGPPVPRFRPLPGCRSRRDTVGHPCPGKTARHPAAELRGPQHRGDHEREALDTEGFASLAQGIMQHHAMPCVLTGRPRGHPPRHASSMHASRTTS